MGSSWSDQLTNPPLDAKVGRPPQPRYLFNTERMK